jgi:hypothetical protein
MHIGTEDASGKPRALGAVASRPGRGRTAGRIGSATQYSPKSDVASHFGLVIKAR